MSFEVMLAKFVIRKRGREGKIGLGWAESDALEPTTEGTFPRTDPQMWKPVMRGWLKISLVWVGCTHSTTQSTEQKEHGALTTIQ